LVVAVLEANLGDGELGVLLAAGDEATALRVQFLEPCAGGLGVVHVALLGLDSEAATRERRTSAAGVTALTGGCVVDVGVRRQHDIRGAAYLFVCVVLRGGQ